ncbi:MAG TPA: O-antigen ligase family protein [Blastocatellia bacterium]|nr:O-antigen ligase family protein [Blastocatellia bacterium]
MNDTDRKEKAGILLKPRAPREPEPVVIEPVRRAEAAREPGLTLRGRHGLAFAGLFVFTFLLYARPNEMFQDFFGAFPVVKVVAIGTLLAYFVSKLGSGERLTVWPLELKMFAVITFLGVFFMPLAAAPGDSKALLLDMWLKVGAIFVLMINLIDTRQRLRALLKLVVICGTLVAIAGISSYLAGNFKIVDKGAGIRIAGVVGGLFGNPNDMATTLDLLLPLAVALALTSRGLGRLIYFVCAGVLAAGVVVTFSRGGFLGLISVGCVLLWKAGKGHRAITAMIGVVMLGVFIAAMPGSYANRISSIFNFEQDLTGSAQARRALLERAIQVAANHIIFGVGMGNYHIYSLHEQVAHNSYLEISAELGVAGLIAYLVLIFSPLKRMRRIKKGIEARYEVPAGRQGRGNLSPLARAREWSRSDHEMYHLSVAFQAAIIGYIVCSSFGSIQYLWYLYYPVAYAIALSRIRAAELREEAADETDAVRARKAKPVAAREEAGAPRGAYEPAPAITRGVGMVEKQRGVLWR